MSKYATTAGVPTRGDAYTKLMHHLKEAEDQAYVLSHLHNTEDAELDKLMAKGWLGVGQLLDSIHTRIVALAANKFQ